MNRKIILTIILLVLVIMAVIVPSGNDGGADNALNAESVDVGNTVDNADFCESNLDVAYSEVSDVIYGDVGKEPDYEVYADESHEPDYEVYVDESHEPGNVNNNNIRNINRETYLTENEEIDYMLSWYPPWYLPYEQERVFPGTTMGALAERIRKAADYLQMQNLIITDLFAELSETHRRAVVVYSENSFFQNVLNRAYYELRMAMENLVFLQKDDLRTAYLYASEYCHSIRHLYTAVSWSAMQDAHSHARDIYHQTCITQDDIDSALVSLLDALGNLTKVQQNTLSELIRDTEHDTLRWFLYTLESFEVFQNARSAARLAYVRVVSQEEIDTAMYELTAARNNLVLLSGEEFLLRIVRVGEISQQLNTRWTSASYTSLVAALNAANSVLRYGGVFGDYYAAANALNLAITNLVVTNRLQLPIYLDHGRLYVHNTNYTVHSRNALSSALTRAQFAYANQYTSEERLGTILYDLRQAILRLQRV